MLFMVEDVPLLVTVIANTFVQIAQFASMIVLMNNLTNGAWLLKQARKFCIAFDEILVRYSAQVYGYFTDIVGGTFFTEDLINDFMSRVYIIIGIFIFFKLAVVAMKYIVNPSEFLDDKLGAQTLVKRIVLGSLIIVFIPTIFSTANRLQSAILRDRVIEKIILPESAYNELVKNGNIGRDLSMLVFKGFFSWNEANPKKGKVYKNFNKVFVYNDLSMFDKDLINEEKNGDYLINYVPLISTLAVGYLLFMLIKYAIEVAYRAIKLFFLQLLSPFVIVNYMLDPSKEEVMKKWTNATVSCYLIIFIRVLTLWFATLMAYYLTNGVDGSTLLQNDTDPLLKCLIILAIFAFLKELPKLISEIFGYNLQENETIGGIMNQGVGILKGFAMAKVAKGVTGWQRGLSAAGMVTSGVTSGMTSVKRAGGIAKTGKLGAANIIGATTSNSFGNVGSMYGGVTSSMMSQTALGGVASTAAASNQSRQLETWGMGERKGEKNNEDVPPDRQTRRSEDQINVDSRPDIKIDNITDAAVSQAVNDVQNTLVNQQANVQQTIAGVNVSTPEPVTGERRTDGGLIIPGSVNVDSSTSILVDSKTATPEAASPVVFNVEGGSNPSFDTPSSLSSNDDSINIGGIPSGSRQTLFDSSSSHRSNSSNGTNNNSSSSSEIIE